MNAILIMVVLVEVEEVMEVAVAKLILLLILYRLKRGLVEEAVEVDIVQMEEMDINQDKLML